MVPRSKAWTFAVGNVVTLSWLTVNSCTFPGQALQLRLMVKEAWDSKELAPVLKRERLKHSRQRENLASHGSGSVLHTGVA